VASEVTLDDLRTAMIPHQEMLCRRRVFDLVGGFDLRYRIAADYDGCAACTNGRRHELRRARAVISVMAGGGISERIFPADRRAWLDHRRTGRSTSGALRRPCAGVDLPALAQTRAAPAGLSFVPRVYVKAAG
jgi:hypothetical protein